MLLVPPFLEPSNPITDSGHLQQKPVVAEATTGLVARMESPRGLLLLSALKRIVLLAFLLLFAHSSWIRAGCGRRIGRRTNRRAAGAARGLLAGALVGRARLRFAWRVRGRGLRRRGLRKGQRGTAGQHHGNGSSSDNLH